VLAVEIAPDQADAVAGAFRDAGLEGVAVRRDLAGRARVVIGRAGGA
jgi:methylase of polypeptide subunit release factors